MSLPLDFSTLPADLLRHLLLGFSGRLHLHATAAIALRHSTQRGDIFSRIGADALLTAWGENPLDGNCVAGLVGAMDKLPPLPQNLLPIIKSIVVHWKPEVTPEIQAALAGEYDGQLALLSKRIQEAPRNLFWWHHLYELCRMTGRWKPLVRTLQQAVAPVGLEPVFGYAMANGVFALGDMKVAAGLYGQAAALPLPIIMERRAAAWLGSGQQDKGAALLAECAGERPWHTGLVLRLYELAAGGAGDIKPVVGNVMVLGYSWNKAEDLGATLDSLAMSDLGEAQIRILDNGSTDETRAVIDRFADRLGSGVVEAISLPVNVGAPAARNWLMELSEVRQSDYVAYIDDDISLPGEWLGRLGAAVDRYPDAGVWGCKVVNHGGPARMQCGEHNLTPLVEERRKTLMSTIMLQDGDFGQADYIRPCTSVTGCVHLFRTERLIANGGFDLRFSPTQYDDLERDLRMVLGGRYGVYTGFLSIAHKRSSGAVSDVGKPEAAGAEANLHKLMAKYEPEEFEAMARTMDSVLLADLTAKQVGSSDEYAKI